MHLLDEFVVAERTEVEITIGHVGKILREGKGLAAGRDLDGMAVSVTETRGAVVSGTLACPVATPTHLRASS